MGEKTELLEYEVNLLKSGLKSLKSDFEQSLQINRALRKLIEKKLTLKPGSETGHRQPIMSECLTSHFKPSYGCRTYMTFNSTVNCKGCGKGFKAYRRLRIGAFQHAERAYNEHCIKQCEEYKKLGKFSGKVLSVFLITSLIRCNWPLLRM